MLTIATLATQLDTQVMNTDAEAPARTAWALAWTNYFYNATANGIPIPPGALTGAQNALETGLTGFSTVVMGVPQGPLKIQAGLISFWGILSASFATIFTACIGITPPPLLATVPAALASQFVINNMPNVTKTQALMNIATALHTTAGIGGIATFPPSVTFSIL